MSIGTISDRLKFSPKQIELLEAGRYEQLPGRAFIRGFVRSYARFLHLPEDELLQQAENELPQENAPPELIPLRNAVIPTHRRRGGIPKGVLIGLGVLIVLGLVIGGVYHWLQSSRLIQLPPMRDNQLLMEDVPPLASAPTASVADASGVSASAADASTSAARAAGKKPASAVLASAAAATAAGNGLELGFTGASWVEVRDAQGKSLYKGLGQKGQQLALKGRPPFRVKIGKANAVSLRFAGQAVDLKPYTRGEVAQLTLPSAR